MKWMISIEMKFLLEYILTKISRSYPLILYHHLSIYNDISISIGFCYTEWYVNYISRLGYVRLRTFFWFLHVTPFLNISLRKHVISRTDVYTVPGAWFVSWKHYFPIWSNNNWNKSHIICVAHTCWYVIRWFVGNSL